MSRRGLMDRGSGHEGVWSHRDPPGPGRRSFGGITQTFFESKRSRLARREGSGTLKSTARTARTATFLLKGARARHVLLFELMVQLAQPKPKGRGA